MRKIVRYYWVGKDLWPKIFYNPLYKEMRIESIRTTRGIRGHWIAEEWPPYKVKITIEEVKSERKAN